MLQHLCKVSRDWLDHDHNLVDLDVMEVLASIRLWLVYGRRMKTFYMSEQFQTFYSSREIRRFQGVK